MAYIIDGYNKYDMEDRQASRYTFSINDHMYAIKEYEVVDGVLQRPLRYDEKEDTNQHYFIYETYEEALRFAHFIKSLN